MFHLTKNLNDQKFHQKVRKSHLLPFLAGCQIQATFESHLYAPILELCKFRFLKNHDSGSSAVFNTLSGFGTGIWIEKGIVFQFTIPHFKSRQKESKWGILSPLRIQWCWFPITIVTKTTFPILRSITPSFMILDFEESTQL